MAYTLSDRLHEAPDERIGDTDNLDLARSSYATRHNIAPLRVMTRQDRPPYEETDIETVNGHTTRLSFSIRVF